MEPGAEGRTVARGNWGPALVIVASGPTAAGARQRLASVRGDALLTVNDGWRIAPHAGALYACDPEWIAHHSDALQDFKGQRFTQSAIAAKRYPGWRRVIGYHRPGLCLTPWEVHFNFNSGAQAVNLAYHMGARFLILVGFDMGKVAGAEHFFGDHPKPLRNDSPYGDFRKAFGALAADLDREGVRVVNTSPTRALKVFRWMDLGEALGAASL